MRAEKRSCLMRQVFPALSEPQPPGWLIFTAVLLLYARLVYLFANMFLELHNLTDFTFKPEILRHVVIDCNASVWLVTWYKASAVTFYYRVRVMLLYLASAAVRHIKLGPRQAK